VTNLVKLIGIDDKRSQIVARKFTQCWLMHYLWPQHCVHNPGTEFTGPEFQMLLQNCHIRDVCTTAKNPQSNAVCERMIHNRKYPKDTLPNTWGHIAKYMGTHCQIHGDTLPNTWGHVSNTKYVYNIYGDRLLIQKNIYGISLITMHAMQAGVHSTLCSIPDNLVFNIDMFFNIPLIADWHAITQRQEHLIHENLMRENRKRRGYDYAPQQLVLKKKWKSKKIG
jgi:hypothetical protein